MTGCAIYARYSSNLQSADSIEDQVRMARAHAEKAGWVVIDVYADHAISGTHAATRPGLQRMMDDAKAGRFSLVVAEALDRLSRNLKDIATIHETLTHWGVEIETLAEGQVNEMHIGLKGTMNALFLKDLAAKTWRGQLGMVEGGKTPSGLGYGYDVVRKLDGAGEPVTGQRAVNVEQAEVVNRIFSEFAAGMTGRAIADGLNRDKIKSPFGGIWRANTIGGNRARGSGILYNQAYVGKLVWNRVSMIKNPETGKRISRPNPPEQWVVRDAPELRIIDDDTWDRVQAIKAKRAVQAPKRRASKRLFSGLIHCGTCGGTYTIVRKGGYGCRKSVV